ncbi:hypothetical protein F5878DRAFT_648218, partial [Lentinula raphanica]
VVDLLEVLQASLEQSGWIFPPNPNTNSESSLIFHRHERLAIQLLRFVGRGNINNTAKTPRLISGQVDSSDMTLKELVSNSAEYGVAKYVVTPKKRFLLHTIIRSRNVALNINLSEKGLGSDNVTHAHHCLSKRIYGIFRSDTDALVDEGYRALNETEIEMGCRGDADEDARDMRVVAQMLSMQSSNSGAVLPAVPDVEPSVIRVHGQPEGPEFTYHISYRRFSGTLLRLFLTPLILTNYLANTNGHLFS